MKPSKKSKKKFVPYQKAPNAKRRFKASVLGSLVGGLTRQAFMSRGLASSTICERWTDIIGDELSKNTAPERIVYPMRAKGNGCLHLRIAHSAMALQIQHLEPMIIERINSYFGYAAVTRLKIIHAPLQPRSGPRYQPRTVPKPLNADQEQHLSETLSHIDDPDLLKTFEKLGRAVIGQNKPE